jgi:hypothetical protein
MALAPVTTAIMQVIVIIAGLWPAKARLKEKPLAARRDCRLGHGRRFRLAALAVPVAVIVSLLGAS